MAFPHHGQKGGETGLKLLHLLQLIQLTLLDQSAGQCLGAMNAIAVGTVECSPFGRQLVPGAAADEWTKTGGSGVDERR